MKPIPVLRHSLILALLVLFSACAYLPQKAEPLRVHLVGLQLQQAEIFEQRYKLKLRIQNPNDFALQIRGVDFQVELNGEDFATGVSNQDLEVPGFGEALMEVEVSSSLWSLARQLRGLGEGRQEDLRYRLHGRLSLAGRRLAVPFETSGELGLTGNNRPR